MAKRERGWLTLQTTKCTGNSTIDLWIGWLKIPIRRRRNTTATTQPGRATLGTRS